MAMAQRRKDPWLPIVLSLDGGGVRGLSTLYILRRIMRRIQTKTREQNDDPVAIATNENLQVLVRTTSLRDCDLEPTSGPRKSATMPALQPKHVATTINSTIKHGAELPFPCHYFDFIVGTSTGGLIAVMLGRLRMNVDDAIKQYWILSNYIFRPPRYIFPYDHRKLEDSIKNVVAEFCCCHNVGETYGGTNELLRQYDYAEEGDPTAHNRLNYSCRVALVAIRRKRQGGDVPWLFRSYTHNRRLQDEAPELNPKILGKGSAKIWEACRASSAAPFYFQNMKIDDSLYMDGGVGYNNPANLAWNEAKWMSNRELPHSGEVRALVSIGTGLSRPETRFGPMNMLHWTRKIITETQSVHQEVWSKAKDSNADYWRFDVCPAENGSHDGLAGIKLSDCKKRKLKKRELSRKEREGSSGSETSSGPDWHQDLQDEAMVKGDNRSRRPKGGYKPDKYAYETFDVIFERTESYCTSSDYSEDETVEQAINACGDLLLNYARQRRLQDPTRFRRFISHPHPNHRDYLKTPRTIQDSVKEKDEN